MRITKWMQVILVGASVMALTACHSTHKTSDDSAIDDANSSYASNGAHASGLGNNSGFGDDSAAGGRNMLTKRTYYFDYDSNVVHPQDKPAIVANADYLISHPKMKIILEGHTDPRGSREYNIGLGERRAKAVAEILTAKGVSPSQIRIVSYGAEKLAVAGRSEADYQQDRRGVIIILKS